MSIAPPPEHPADRPVTALGLPVPPGVRPGVPAVRPGVIDVDIGSIFARLADGDHAAVLVVVDAHGDGLAAALRRRAAEVGVVPPSPEEVAPMVLALGFALADAARGEVLDPRRTLPERLAAVLAGCIDVVVGARGAPSRPPSRCRG